MSETECKLEHAHLEKIVGPLHPSGKDYRCIGCRQQFRVEELGIEVVTGSDGKQYSIDDPKVPG